jgi:MFS family permease
MQDSEKQYANTRSYLINDDDSFAEEPSLPHNGLPTALITGIIGGLFNVAISVVTTLMNTSTYQDAARSGDAMSLATAQLLFSLSCINYVVALVVSFVAGFIVGKLAVSRRLGFYTGALVGAVTYLGSALLQYIPNYPGHISSSTSSVMFTINGVLFMLLLTIIWAFVGALISLWGTFIASKKHPYYQAKLAQQEE